MEDRPETTAPMGSSFTSSADPIGEGSNTPVGNEPRDFSAWDARQPEPGTGMDSAWNAEMDAQSSSSMPTWGIGGLLAAGTLGALIYAWFQRRRRKSRVERMREMLADLGMEYGAGLPRVVGETFSKSRSPWLPFLLLPLAMWLRSRGGKAEDMADDLMQPLKLEDRGHLLAKQGAAQLERYGRKLIGEIEERDPTVKSSGWGWTPWLVAVPVVGGAAYLGKQYLGGNSNANGSFGFSDGQSSGASTKLVRDVMSRDPDVVKPDAKVNEAARKMRDLDVGSLPVCDGQRLVGMITDRDISIRATAEAKDPKTTAVREVMSPEVAWVFEDEPATMAASVMRQRQIRRLPVLDRNDKLVGIVALGDLATDLQSDTVKGETLEEISRPTK
jgi:CBS domain-containing protein